MISVRGFCDLNVCMDGENKTSLKNTCQALLDLGYRVVALNNILDESVFEPKKKKKKGEVQEKTDLIPAPCNEDIVQYFKGKLDIYERLTVTISDQMQAHKLSQSPNAKLYTILAVIPASQVAFQHACSTMEVDLISFDPDNMGVVKCTRKAYNMAVERGISFELMYAPAIRDSTARKNIIQLAHSYHAFGKSKQIIVSSGASNPFHVRGPYDIINLSLLFGLSEEQSKAALTSSCRFLLLRAGGRRLGKTLVIPSNNNNVHKEPEKSNDVDSDEMELDYEQPVHKKLRQDLPQTRISLVNDT